MQNATGSRLFESTLIETLTNGEVFYEEELAAIAKAEESINLEAYVFAGDGIGQRFRDAAVERARNGVHVRFTLDAIGAMGTDDNFFKPMTQAGGKVGWYHPAEWYTWDRINNRTHRELLIVDGKVAFTGGAGIADFWHKPIKGQPPWRDTFFRLSGDAVDGLQSVFAENWLEAKGDVLAAPNYYRASPAENGYPSLVVFGTPTTGGSTKVRTAIQMTIAAARKTIFITNPYFLPDNGLQQELANAVKRSVRVEVITPGKQSDQTLTSRASRRLYGNLIESGVTIHEYQPTMIHVKTIVVDSFWSVIGTTNFDPRSFGLNDEVNVVAQSEDLAQRLELDFRNDLEKSKLVTLEEWRERPIWEKGAEFFGRLFERQQ
jgi:cardiolipin synthase